MSYTAGLIKPDGNSVFALADAGTEPLFSAPETSKISASPTDRQKYCKVLLLKKNHKVQTVLQIESDLP